MEMEVRWATIQDANIIHYIYHNNRNNVPGEQRKVDYSISDIEKLIVSPDRCRLIVATKDNSIVGFLLAYDMVMWCYVDVIVVRAEYRDQGIGAMLLQFMHANANKAWWAIEVCTPADSELIKHFFDIHHYETQPGVFVWRYHMTDPAMRAKNG